MASHSFLKGCNSSYQMTHSCSGGGDSFIWILSRTKRQWTLTAARADKHDQWSRWFYPGDEWWRSKRFQRISVFEHLIQWLMLLEHKCIADTYIGVNLCSCRHCRACYDPILWSSAPQGVIPALTSFQCFYFGKDVDYDRLWWRHVDLGRVDVTEFLILAWILLPRVPIS